MPRAHSTSPAFATADALTAWFQQHGKDYPWRRTQEPYAILVSEVMLQQTQITTVLERGYYTRWLERFPDWQTLAAASEEDVLKAWEGLGYYRRARHLQKLARAIVEKHGVASFAFGLAEPLVDGNVARVLSRLHDDARPIDSAEGKEALWSRARALVQASDDPRALNSALMELGQTHCRPQKPTCTACPVRSFCRATEPESLPVKSPRAKTTEVCERVFFHRTHAGVLLEQERGSRRTGLWKLPAMPEPDASALPPVLMRTSYGITRYKVTLWVHESPAGIAEHAGDALRLIPHSELDALPMPAPYRRALQALLRDRTDELL
jgi:A/G-specific adenine glycosylase